uniref:Solute carrier family 22 member 13a n=1 Tax=Sphaeramia orbicularis TaxID=375764 RepID=A0A673B1R1_9TELE
MADFGEILRNIGEFGLFQRVTLAALCFINFIQGFLLASFLFIEKNPDRHCNTDWILGLDPNLTTDEQLNLTLPREADGTFSRCQMFVPVDWDIDAIREFGLNKTTSCQNGWVYKSTLFGRKRAIQVPAVISFIFVLATGFCPDMYSYIVFSFFAGVGAGGYRVTSIVLITEWIGASKRSWGVCLTLLFTSVGQCALAGLEYFIRDWRLVQIIIAAPLGVVLLYIWCVLFIPESARWLLSRGRTEEAKQFSLIASSLGLHLNIANLGLNVFLTQFIFGAIEIPAHILCIWLLEVFGRKPLFMLTLATAGLSSILILAPKCMFSISFKNYCPLKVSRLGGIVAPLLNITATCHWIIPIVVSSSLTFISGGLGFMLPETRRRELPDSIDEAELSRVESSRYHAVETGHIMKSINTVKMTG